MARRKTKSNGSYLEKLDSEVASNQSRLSMVLGALIVIVVGILVFNYFSKGRSDESLGPSQQTIQQEGDVSPENLPGKYAVKEGDTLFLIAEKYYQDGDKFTEIAKANNISDVNSIEVGQVLEISKLAGELAQAPSPTPSLEPDVTPTPSVTPSPMVADEDQPVGTGGANTTIWGPKIAGNTYTVVEGDWLSKISARAYGDIYAYAKIAKANNIPNPDLIYPGQILTLPR